MGFLIKLVFNRSNETKCLHNVPVLAYKKGNIRLPGQLLTLNQQCQIINGTNSCKVRKDNMVSILFDSLLIFILGEI